MRIEVTTQLKGDKMWRKGHVWDTDRDGPLPPDLQRELNADSDTVKMLEDSPSSFVQELASKDPEELVEIENEFKEPELPAFEPEEEKLAKPSVFSHLEKPLLEEAKPILLAKDWKRSDFIKATKAELVFILCAKLPSKFPELSRTDAVQNIDKASLVKLAVENLLPE